MRRSLVVAWLALAVSGCGTCEHDGARHRAGESFEAGDGCNTCSCRADGSVLCTRLACVEDTGDTDG